MSLINKEYRIGLGDTDAAGRVFFARPLEWCHRLWEDHLENCGMPLKTLLEGSEVHLPIVSSEFEFKGQLKVGDKVNLRLLKIDPGGRSISVYYEVLKSETPAILGKITHVCIDVKTGQPIPIPAKLKKIL